MGLFGKKEQKPVPQPALQVQPPPQANVPTEEVLNLRQQGISNAQIAERLQKEGYKTHQIFDAMNQADLGRPGGQIPGAPYFDEAPQQAPGQNQMPMQMGDDQAAEPAAIDEKIEEIAEAIIEEKWNELLKDINKIVEWKTTMESNMKALEQRQNDLKGSFDNLQRALLAKINDYDQNITNVGTELKALEKVFQKILPQFTENVNELSRTVKDLKKK